MSEQLITTHCFSQRPSQTGNLLWCIEDSVLDMSNGEYVRSVSFQASSYQWFAKFHPKGETTENKDSVSIFFHLDFDDALELTSTLSTRITIHICNKTYTKNKLLRTSLAEFSEDDPTWGWNNILKSNELKKKLINNKLYIKLSIIVFTKPNSKSLQFDENNEYFDNKTNLSNNMLKLFKNPLHYDIILSIKGKTTKKTNENIIKKRKLSKNETENIYENTNKEIINLKIKCHKCILSNSSEIFRAMFDKHFKESNENIIEIYDEYNNIDPYLMKEMIKYIYCREIDNINNVDYGLLMTLADKYCIEKLVIFCLKKLGNIINVNNVSQTFFISNKFEHIKYAKKIKKMCLNFMVNNLSNVIKTDSYKSLISKNIELTQQILTNVASCNDDS